MCRVIERSRNYIWEKLLQFSIRFIYEEEEHWQEENYCNLEFIFSKEASRLKYSPRQISDGPYLWICSVHAYAKQTTRARTATGTKVVNAARTERMDAAEIHVGIHVARCVLLYHSVVRRLHPCAILQAYCAYIYIYIHARALSGRRRRNIERAFAYAERTPLRAYSRRGNAHTCLVPFHLLGTLLGRRRITYIAVSSSSAARAASSLRTSTLSPDEYNLITIILSRSNNYIHFRDSENDIPSISLVFNIVYRYETAGRR